MLLVLIKRFLGKGNKDELKHDRSAALEQLVLEAQRGDAKLRNELITEYQPYIAKVAGKFCRRYIDPARDDEYSVALDAFHEAIHQFSPKSGRSFLSFAETVIRRRLIDHLRKEQKYNLQIPYTAFETKDDEDQVVNPIDVQQAVQKHEEHRIAEERKQEILAITQELSDYGVTFSDLAASSPKHVDSRQLLFGIARTLAASETMMALLAEKKQLPVKQLLSSVSVSRKTVERNRKYIIAVALILHGQYPYLSDYIAIEPSAAERRDDPRA